MKTISKIFYGVISAFLLAVLYACSGDPALERTFDSEVATLSGTFVTENPDQINFPVRVLFAIDASASMGFIRPDGSGTGADPLGKRMDAVRNFISDYNDQNDNVSFEIMMWNSGIVAATRNEDGQRGFTKDTDELNRVLSYNVNESLTDYWDTIEGIRTDIVRDIRREENEGNISRTKYIVIFLSDGQPDANGRTNNPLEQKTQLTGMVEGLVEELDDIGVGSFNFNTFLLEDPALPKNTLDRAEDILQSMATAGAGQFKRFENADSIDFNIVDVRLTVEYFVKFIVAYNHNVIPGVRVLYVDSDGDGLSDEEEREFGSDPVIRDTDFDGMSDYLEQRISAPGNEFDPTLFDSPCVLSPQNDWPDTDTDGLADCEEFVIGTARKIADTDADGIPDLIEFIARSNPLDAETTSDADFDGRIDWQEIHHHTNVRSNDPIIQQRYSYQYNIVDQGLIKLNQGTQSESHVRQFGFTVSNIRLMDTLLRADGQGYLAGDNVIELYIAQVPDDQPNLTPVYRRATVTVNYDDVNKDIHLTPSNFELIP
jgi:hypothetical protein